MSKMTVRIRPLTEADAQPFAALRREISAEGEHAWVSLSLDDELRRSFDAFRAELPLPAPNSVLGAFASGELVGAVVMVWPGVPAPAHDSASLWGVFVLPPLRGRGIGQLLVRQAVGHAFSLGMRCVCLQFRKPNDAALRLYRSQGFEVCGPDGNDTHYPGFQEDCIHMRIDNPVPEALPDGTQEMTR